MTSIVTEARNYADTASKQGRSTLTSASGRLRTLTGDGKGIALNTITLARRQAYVTLGASDAIVATIVARKDLPSEVRQSASKLADTTKERLRQANERAAKAQGKVALIFEAARNFSLADTTADAKDKMDGRVDQVKDAFDKLADRGAQVGADLRHDPVLVRIIRDADKGVERATNEVTSVAQKLRSRAAKQAKRETAAVTSTPVRATPAKAVPSHKTTVRKTPAGDAAISTTPTHRAAAEEAAVRKAAAVKAAATRKAAAEQAAATRKAAADKAAATRKAAAEAREEAAATRRAAAVKAAATRKANAKKAPAASK